MKSHFLVLLFLLIGLPELDAQKPLYSPEELKADLVIYERGLNELHPNAFEWYPQDSFAVWIDQVEAQLSEPMNDLDFRRLLFPVHQKVGCGHSRIAGSTKAVKAKTKAFKKGAVRRALPFNGKIFDGKYFVLTDLTADSLLTAGTEILAIDDLPMPDILKKLAMPLTSDGFNTTHFNQALSKFLIPFYQLHIAEKDQYKLTIRDTLGQQRDLQVDAWLISKALNKERAKAKKKNPPPPPTTSKAPTKKLIFKNKKGYRLWRSLQDSSIFILRVPAFKGSAGIRFHKKTFKYLNALDYPHHLVLDLRGNGGGNANESATLASMLCPDTIRYQAVAPHKLPKEMYRHLNTNGFARARHQFLLKLFAAKKEKGETVKINIHYPPHKRVRYTGPLSVFVDGYSFSASSLTSSYIRDQNRATFYGEETGGGQFGTNALTTPYLSLPNTGIRIRMPMYQLRQLVQGENKGRGIFPDVETFWTIEDVLEQRDVDLEALLRSYER